jgi:hypothetical protein
VLFEPALKLLRGGEELLVVVNDDPAYGLRRLFTGGLLWPDRSPPDTVPA